MRVAIIGGAGYSGLELARWLSGHPAELVAVSSRKLAGRGLRELAPEARDLRFVDHEAVEELDWDLAFLAVPADVSVLVAPRLLARGRSVIDLSGAFRLPAEDYPVWYGFEHSAPEALARAAYGLPELFAPKPTDGRADGQLEGPVLISNPGCYATALALSVGPLVEADCLGDTIMVDGKSGTTGAGKKASERLLFSEVGESVAPYRVGHHQHTPEMERCLGRLGRPRRLLFAPHLVPMTRGLLTTSFAEGRGTVDPQDILRARYEGSALVEVMDAPPGTGPVRNTAFARVHALRDPRSGAVVSFGAIDNLVKGAAGQALQNLNAIMGLDLDTGLRANPGRGGAGA